MPRTIYRPVDAFVTVDNDGIRSRFDPSMLIPEGHWVLKGREMMFVAVDMSGDAPVETATADPGSKRSVRRKASE